jgi:ATP phosphoribosyltransferase
MMLKGVLAAEKKVGLMLNVGKDDLEKVLAILPALHNPTISSLADDGWFALTTIVDENIIREIAPELIAAGAEGIVEYALNKIFY